MSQNDFNEFKDLGRQIKDSVMSVVNMQEFNDLKTTIKSATQDLSRDLKSAFKSGVPPTGPTPPCAGYTETNGSGSYTYTYTYTDPCPPSPPQPRRPVPPQPPQPRPATPPQAVQAPPVIRRKDKLPGSVAGVLFTVFGGLGLGIVFAAVLVMGILALALGWEQLFTGLGLGVFLPLLALCIVLLGCGSRLRGRVRRCRRYKEAMAGEAFRPIEELAYLTGSTPKFVAKDLRRMIQYEMLPGAHVDDEGTYFILDEETYQAYLAAKQKQEELQKQPPSPERSAEAKALEEEANRILQQIRDCNDGIPEEAISRKISEMEKTAAAIFHYVGEHPHKLPEIRRFLSYYLPTTLKLLEAYKKFNDQPMPTEQQQETKKEIEDALDTVNKAFANLLDSLMQEERMDVSADISVLKAMMEQEGLTGSKPGSGS